MRDWHKFIAVHFGINENLQRIKIFLQDGDSMD